MTRYATTIKGSWRNDRRSLQRSSTFCTTLVGLLVLLTVTAGAQITPSDDSYTLTSSPTKNFGTATALAVESAGATSYVRFDLSGIPPTVTGSMVAKATLKIYVGTVTTAGSFNVDLVTSSWKESTITATNAPTLGSAIASAVAVTTADKNQYLLVDVTAAAVEWLNGTSNDGLAIVPDGTVSFALNSKETTTTSHPPELDVVLTGPQGPPGAITGVTAGAGLAGGGTKGNVTLSLLTSCASGQVLQWNGSTWVCATTKGNGTITGVTAGTDLTGGGTSGVVSINLDTTKIPQLNVANTFAGNQTVTGNITASGTVSGGLGSFSGNSSNSILNVTQNATSGPGFAIVGSSSNNAPGLAAVLGQELSHSGNVVFGVEGFVFGPEGAGVYGENGSPQSALGAANTSGAGVWGDSGSGTTGLLGTAGNTEAAITLNNSPQTATILAENENTSKGVLAPAVAGFSFAPNGMAVVGSGPVHSNKFLATIADIFQAYGVAGDSPAGTGVAGFTDSATAVSGQAGAGVGVQGTSDNGDWIVGITNGSPNPQQSPSAGILGEDFSNNAFNIGVSGFSNTGTAVEGTSPDETAIFTSTDTAGAQTFIAANEDGTSCGVLTGKPWGGSLFCTGSKSAIVPLADSRWVALYAVESPENWFEDFGSGQLVDGSALIDLEPTFAETVNTGMDYHVFPSPSADCKGLYVAEKTATSFVVRELGGGKSNIAFDYRIVGRRKGYESIRLRDMTEIHAQSVAVAQNAAKRAVQRMSERAQKANAIKRLTPHIQAPILPHPAAPLQRSGLPARPVGLPHLASKTTTP